MRVWVHEADFLDVQPGRRLQISTDAHGLPPFEAEISWTSSQAETREDWGDGGYFEAYARPLGSVPDGIAPGMSVMGEMLDAEGAP
jgi:hypothetical protein